MASFIVEGGHRLSGEITPQGAKNEALQILSAVLLTPEEVVVHNIPEILDITNLILMLEGIGVKVRRLGKGSWSFQADEVNESYIGSDEFIAKCASLRG
ncbi:MAG: UDP-N-acetylglucosamine 1-carboxyvinyltransferase, partial [Bacteroidales bacterium]|nr:UDP-N-acetylglucosamine 1-carboxyvinyltransferase [Bacteroidales bacterium]